MCEKNELIQIYADFEVKFQDLNSQFINGLIDQSEFDDRSEQAKKVIFKNLNEIQKTVFKKIC